MYTFMNIFYVRNDVIREYVSKMCVLLLLGTIFCSKDLFQE